MVLYLLKVKRCITNSDEIYEEKKTLATYALFMLQDVLIKTHSHTQIKYYVFNYVFKGT